MSTRVLEHAAKLQATAYAVFPIKAGAKTPACRSWTEYRTKNFNLGDFPEDGGLGLICGRKGLEVLDFEGRAVEDLWERFTAEIGEELLEKLQQWYERTPSGGYHFYYSVDEPKKRQLAFVEDGVAIETLGEGQYCIVAPTEGYEDLSREWGTPSTLSAGEHQKLLDTCRALSLVSRPQIVEIALEREEGGDSFMDRAKEWVDLNLSWSTLLKKYGFTFIQEREDVQYWRRPGKTEAEYSVTVNCKGNDRLINFSSSLHDKFPPAPEGVRSYDRLDLIAAYEHEGDRIKAAKKTVPNLKDTWPELPDEFWKFHPVLEQIRHEAWLRVAPPDGTLGALLAEISYRMDHRILLPGKKPPNLFMGLLGESGRGKGEASNLAQWLLPKDHPTDPLAARHSVGSGEGISKAFYGKALPEEQPQIEVAYGEGIQEMLKSAENLFGDEEIPVKSKSPRRGVEVLRRVRNHVILDIREGQTVAELTQRNGSTLAVQLRLAASGEALGMKNANDDRSLEVKALSYRFAVIFGIQPSNCAELMADVDGGTPQRFIWALARRQNFPEEYRRKIPSEEIPKLALRFPEFKEFQPLTLDGETYGLMTYDEEIEIELRDTLFDNRLTNPLDSQWGLNMRKLSAVFAYMFGKTHVDNEIWGLTKMYMSTSDRIRNRMVGVLREKEAAKAKASTQKAIERTLAVKQAENQLDEVVIRVAKNVYKHVVNVHGADGSPCTVGCITGSRGGQLTLGRDKKHRKAAEEYAIEQGWVKEDDERRLVPGASKPAGA